MKLLSVSNTKLEKGRALGFETYGLSLAPATLAGGPSVCPNASPACKAACLFYAGMGVFSNVQKARIEKTRFFHQERERFLSQLKREIECSIKQAERNGLKAVFRLNVLSDILWENYGIPQAFPEIQMYDYTKAYKRLGKVPRNYDLTLSRSEKNDAIARSAIAAGHRVAVVFRETLPPEWGGARIVDGDKTDLRFLDPKGVVVGLRAKGRGKADRTGFVLD